MRAALTRWAPKAPLEFAALMNAHTVLEDYAALDFPILILRGEHAPMPTRVIADALPDAMDCARVEVIAGAGHMGPMTHADAVSARIVAHIMSAEAMPAVHARTATRRLRRPWMPPDQLRRKTGRACGPFRLRIGAAAYGNFQ